VYNTTTNKAPTTQGVTNLEAVMSYSFTDCMTQYKSSRWVVMYMTFTKSCVTLGAMYNQQYGTASEIYPCKAVTYGANLTASLAREQEGNCYLKNARGFGIYDPSGVVMSVYIDV
jgi:hypothetical protein